MIKRRLRFRELLALGVVRNRQTLRNWIRDRGFPPGQMTGPNSRTWGEDEVQAYVDSRPTAAKPEIPLKPGSRRGRPPREDLPADRRRHGDGDLDQRADSATTTNNETARPRVALRAASRATRSTRAE